jgi:prepilin-type processing-associated H-X9-DG protein
MYCDESDDQVPYNSLEQNWNEYPMNWVWGVMSYETGLETPGLWSHADSTNTALLLDPKRSQLGPFIKSSAVFKCPADKSWILLGGQRYPRVRSYSMNFEIGDYVYGDPASISYTRRSQSGAPVWVFIDEHEDTIHDGRFRFDGPLGTQPQSYGWLNIPAARHNGRGVLSFSDGHVEQHKWADGRTLMPVTRVRRTVGLVPNSADVAWLAQQSAR